MNTGFNLLGQFDEELSQLHDGSLEGGQPSFDLMNFQNEEKVGFDNDSGLLQTDHPTGSFQPQTALNIQNVEYFEDWEKKEPLD